MSSSGYHPPPHLHRVNLHSHGKRPFEECGGYDSDPDTSMPIQPTTSGTSSSSNNNRFPTTASPTGSHNPETRNKRARSTSSTSTDDSSSNPSSSSGYNTAQSSSRSDIFSDGPSALPASAVDCPIHPVASLPSFVATQDAHMSDLHLPLPPTQPQRTHVPTPPTPEDTLRTSLQRFAEFDRQIAALRTSLAATRSPPLPTLGPSVDGDPTPSNDHWHSNPYPSNFLSNGSSGLPPSTAMDPASSTVAVAPSETLNSLSTFASSNDSGSIAAATSTASGTVPSASFPPTYGNIPRYPPYPSYRPSAGGSSSLAAHERVGDTVSSSSTPTFMRPSSNENTTRVGTRSLVSVESSAPPSTSYIRHVRRSLSPLVFPPDPSTSSPPSIVTDDILLRYRTLYGDGDPVNGRSHRRAVDSPASLDREVSSRLEDHLGEQLRLSQTRLGDRVRVIREHSVERESAPSVFDVFNIGESSQDRNRPAPVREPAASRYTSIAEPVPPRVPGSHNERSRGSAPITAVNANQVPSQDLHTRLHSSWTSIPSSNSLMSESASERRHALALERFRARLRRSSFDADDESDSRWSGSSRGERERESGDLGVASPVPPSPSVESAPGTGTSSHFPPLGATRAPLSTTNRAEPVTSPSLQRSFSELFAETQRIAREEGAEAWLLDWDTSRVAERERQRERERERQLDRERQRERVWEWERERERSSQDVRGRSFASGLSLASTSSAREESSHPPIPASSAPPRPSLGQLGAGPNTTTPNATAVTTTTNNSQQYSYSNLNLSSFQSGLFRDSLRRNAEVDQASFSTSGPMIPPSVTTGESRAVSRLGLEDSGSEMDLDDFVRTRPPSPEWSRPQPYAGRTPPPDYSPPPRNFSLRPGFSVLRRSSIINYDSPARSQHPNRNTAVFTRPIPPAPYGPTRPTSYENNNQPAAPERTERDRFLPARILESFYRSHEDGRRNASAGNGQPYHLQHPPNQNHALASGSSAVSRNERNDVLGGPRSASGNGNGNGNGNRPGPEVVGENRRSSLGLGGSIRSRLARLANPQSTSNATDMSSSSRQRSPPRPIGARPQVAEQRRRGSLVFGSVNVLEHESRPDARSVSGPPHWAVNAGAAEPSVMTRDVPWRASSGPRNAFAPPPPASGSARAEISEGASRVEEQRSRLRTLRQRLQLDRGSEGMRVFRPGMLRAAIGRRGNLGDYVPDELFDDSYEALLSLSSMLGDVRSRVTPEDVITSLPTGTFKDWKKEDSETRCPICLDDYEPSDVVTKLIECPHWLHKNCLEQWLRTANTCPVCREKVKASPKPAPPRRRPYRDLSAPSEVNHGANSSTSGNGLSGRPPHTNPQTNNGRPVSFAAMVFDRLMNDGREGTAESWSSSPSQVPPPTRDARSVYLERLRAQQQQQHPREPHQPPHTHDYHDVYVELPPPHELPYDLRVPPSSQPASSSRPTAGVGLGGADGPGVRPFGFVSLLRGQGSDSSMSTSSSTSMVVDEVGTGHGPSGRRSMAGTSGGPGSGSGSLFLNAPTMQRRETAFPFVPPSSGTFAAVGRPATPPLLPPLPQQQQSGFDAHGHGHPPTMVISSSTESSRDWRTARGYDALFNVEGSRSSSSSSSVSASQPRPMSVANRIPVDEDSPYEDYVFGWSLHRGRLGHTYPFEEEPTRRRSGEGASSGP